MARVLRHPVGGHAFAVFGMLLATYVRIPLQPWLGDRIPFGPQLLFLLLTVWLVGTGPGLTALSVGAVATIVFVVPPAGTPFAANPADLFAVAVYGLVGVGAIALFDRTRKERELAKRRAGENAELAARLREASRQKDEYLALLAHELRNPLAPIRTGLDLLDRSPSEEVAVNIRQKLRRQVRQLVRIVDDLLDVSRIVRGRLRLEREPVDLREIVATSLDTIRPSLDRRGHTVLWQPPDRPVFVDGDRIRLVQVVANLLGNAGKYTPNGGTVRVELDAVGSRSSLRVVDNGIGIPRDRLDAVFRMFARAHAPTNRDHGGLGLGLAIVHRLVELHDGEVRAESAGEGLGSRFVVELPTVPAPVEPVVGDDPVLVAAHNATATDRAKQVAPSPLSDTGEFHVGDTVVLDATIRVLIVDDNVDAAETLGKLIALEGCTTRVETDGPSALDCLDLFRPHVVLLDIGMPGMNGYEVARAIRQRHDEDEPRPRLIAVTGWGSSEDRRRSAEAGFDHHLVKPVATQDLLNEIRPKSGGTAVSSV